MMKAVLCSSLEGIDALEIKEIEIPKPASDEVLIKVGASAMNFADSLIVKGRYQNKPELPFSPGLECAGTIEGLGAEVSGFEIGQKVMAILDHGGFAEYATAKASDVFAIPDDMDFVTATAIPIAYGTSYHGLIFKAGLKAGEFLVVHGASGGVGLTAVEIGKQVGATVIATASTPEKLEICKSHGADHVLLSDTQDLRGEIKKLTDGLGAHVTYDPVGGQLFEESLRSTRQDGRIMIVGFASGNIPQIPANIVMVKNISIIGFHFGAYRKLDPASLKASFQELMGFISKGNLKPHVFKTYELEAFRSAYDDLLKRRSTGKLVIRP